MCTIMCTSFHGQYMGVSLNGGTPKSSILIGFSIFFTIPLWGTSILGNPHMSFHDPTLHSHTTSKSCNLLRFLDSAGGAREDHEPKAWNFQRGAGLRLPPLKLTYPLKIDPWNLGDSELGNHPFFGGFTVSLRGETTHSGGIKEYKCVVLE